MFQKSPPYSNPDDEPPVVTSFGSRIGGEEQSDWLVTTAQVHQCRVEHKHNTEPWIVMDNPTGIPLFNMNVTFGVQYVLRNMHEFVRSYNVTKSFRLRDMG